MKRRVPDPIERFARLGAAALTLAAAAGCGKNTPPGDGIPGTATSVGRSVLVPIDAVPSPDGSTVYLIAEGDKGAAVYSFKGGSATRLLGGPSLSAPLGIATATDGTSIFVADLAGGDDDAGAIYEIDSAGGQARVVSGTAGSAPRSLAVVRQGDVDQIYFTGADSGGAPAVLKVPAGGGEAAVVYRGPDLVDPTGIAVDRSGSVYVMDTASTGGSRMLKIAGGLGSEMLGGLQAGYPAGVALAENESALLFASTDASGAFAIHRLALAGGATAMPLTIANLGMVDEPAGLHRAAKADVYAFVDSGAGAAGNVWLLAK